MSIFFIFRPHISITENDDVQVVSGAFEGA